MMAIKRNTGKKKPGPTPQPKDEITEILQDIRITLDEILELLKSELEAEDEPEHPQPQPPQAA